MFRKIRSGMGRVGCDGVHTLLCGSYEFVTHRGRSCEWLVKQGGTTVIFRPYLRDRGGFFVAYGRIRKLIASQYASGARVGR